MTLQKTLNYSQKSDHVEMYWWVGSTTGSASD